MKDKLRAMLVDAIIGDIPTVYTSDIDPDDIEPLSDEEMAEIDAEADDYQISPERQAQINAWAKEFGQWAGYCCGMKARGLEPLDWYEWQNMAEKPTLPDNTEQLS